MTVPVARKKAKRLQSDDEGEPLDMTTSSLTTDTPLDLSLHPPGMSDIYNTLHTIFGILSLPVFAR